MDDQKEKDNQEQVEISQEEDRSRAWILQGLCPKDGGTLGGFLTLNCTTCSYARDNTKMRKHIGTGFQLGFTGIFLYIFYSTNVLLELFGGFPDGRFAGYFVPGQYNIITFLAQTQSGYMVGGANIFISALVRSIPIFAFVLVSAIFLRLVKAAEYLARFSLFTVFMVIISYTITLWGNGIFYGVGSVVGHLVLTIFVSLIVSAIIQFGKK